MKGLKTVFLIVMLITAAAFHAGIARAGDTSETLVLESANRWLALIDNGRYEESWEYTAGLFRSQINRVQWGKTVSGVRGQFGRVISRRMLNVAYTTSVPGGPDGQYALIQYQTSFERKASAVETITSLLDQDGWWRVAGYFVK